MTFVKFGGFLVNNNEERQKFSKDVEPLVKETILGICNRYKSTDPNFPAHFDIHEIHFGRKPGDIFSWQTDFYGELHTTDYGVAEELIRDSKKSYRGYGIGQTFQYKNDSFQVYLNFFKIRLG